MKLIKRLFKDGMVLAFAMALPIMAIARGDCPYCSGTGKVVKNLTVSTYGNDTKKKCPECGEWHYSGHTHVHCSHCGGTGYRKSGSSSSSSDYSSGYYEGNDLGLPNPYAVARNLRYGCRWCDEEIRLYNELKKNDPNLAQRYETARGYMDDFIIWCNEGAAKAQYNYVTPQQVVNMWQNACTNFNNFNNSGAVCTPQLQPYLQQVCNIAEQTGNQYCNTCQSFYNLRQQQEALDNYLLYRNMIW
ncbi:MAG: hypothetical protein LIP09_04135 [Bacteroidales bacterium]|nr:hypothetical protein [Bacteroidales bacterium]